MAGVLGIVLPVRVLVVDDDAELRDLLTRALERDGHVVAAAGSLAAARGRLTDGVDVIVLDLALPDGEGPTLCRELRAQASPVPVLMLTAHTEIPTRVRSLDAGADDFLGKPFSVAELRARVRALGRRRAPTSGRLVLSRGEVRVDVMARRARDGERDVTLTAREWAVLEVLALRGGRVISSEVILEEAWGEVSEAGAASLHVIVGRIRKKLGASFIRTARGEGYALEVE